MPDVTINPGGLISVEHDTTAAGGHPVGQRHQRGGITHALPPFLSASVGPRLALVRPINNGKDCELPQFMLSILKSVTYSRRFVTVSAPVAAPAICWPLASITLSPLGSG